MRKAFVALFDYATYLHNVARDNAIQPNGPVPKGMFGYNASTPAYQYSLTTAVNELKLTHSPTPGESWFTHGFTIPLFYNSGNVPRNTACQLIKTALETITATEAGAGPMTATITGLDWSSSYLPDVVYAQHTFAPMYSIGWAPDYYDPDDYTTPMLDSEFGTYPFFSGYNNSTMDDLVRDAAKESDLAKREKMYKDIQYQSQQDAPYLWLTQPNNFNIFRSWVHVEGGLQNYFNPMYSDLYYPLFTKS